MIDTQRRQRPARLAAWRRLNHLQADQFFRGVDPEIRPPMPGPAKTPDRAWYPAAHRIGADAEAQPKSCSSTGANLVAAKDARPGRQRVGGHRLHRLGLKQAHAVEFAAIQQHLAKTEI